MGRDTLEDEGVEDEIASWLLQMYWLGRENENREERGIPQLPVAEEIIKRKKLILDKLSKV